VNGTTNKADVRDAAGKWIAFGGSSAPSVDSDPRTVIARSKPAVCVGNAVSVLRLNIWQFAMSVALLVCKCSKTDMTKRQRRIFVGNV